MMLEASRNGIVLERAVSGAIPLRLRFCQHVSSSTCFVRQLVCNNLQVQLACQQHQYHDLTMVTSELRCAYIMIYYYFHIPVDQVI